MAMAGTADKNKDWLDDQNKRHEEAKRSPAGCFFVKHVPLKQNRVVSYNWALILI